MNFSTNQVNQFYVYGKDIKGVNHDMTVEGEDKKKAFYLTYKNGNDVVLRTDEIQPSKVLYTTVKKAADQKIKMKKYTLGIKGEPVKGKFYTIRIKIAPYQGFGDEDYHIITLTVQAKDNIPANLMKAFATEFKLNTNEFEKELLTVEASAANLIVTTLPQTANWIKGVSPLEIVNLEISFAPVELDGIEDDEWLTGADKFALEAEKNAIPNGYMVADMEYFFMGERGDQYRESGYPNIIRTKYLVDETKGYDVLTIHYYSDDSKEGVQKSEKDITIVAETSEEGPWPINTLIGNINDATGLKIATLA